MPWTRTDPQKERLRFVMKAEEGVFSMKELCARFGVSRQAGYATLQRWRVEGAEGLKERSRAPLYSPQRMSDELTALLLAMRRAHPDWGPRKIHAYLQGRDAGLVLPAASTTGELYRRAGLVHHGSSDGGCIQDVCRWKSVDRTTCGRRTSRASSARVTG